MSANQTKTFLTDNEVAVLLPGSVGFAPGTEVVVEQTTDGVRIKRAPLPKVTPEEARARNQRMAAEIRAIWDAAGGPPKGPIVREPIEFPDRPGLY